MKKFIKTHLKYVIGVVILLAVGLTGFLMKRASVKSPAKETKEIVSVKTVIVEIRGAVENPGIYYTEANARITDVIVLAGGLLKDAETTNINMAKKVKDEMKIVIPFKEEKDKKTDDNNESETTFKVHLNKATIKELVKVPGIGIKIAHDIVIYRETNGDFQSLEELKKVKGIKDKLYDKIKDYFILEES